MIIDDESLGPFVEMVSAPAAVTYMRRGEALVLIDDVSGRGEAAIVLPAQFAETSILELLRRWSSNPLCVALPAARLAALKIKGVHGGSLPLSDAGAGADGRFASGIEARMLTTGTPSARDLVTTVRLCADPGTLPSDFVQPGHVVPVGVSQGGVVERPELADAAVDLCRIARLRPAALIQGIGCADGLPADPTQVFDIASGSGLRLVAISDLLAHRLSTEALVQRVVEARLPVNGFPWRAVGYAETGSDREHMALVLGDVREVAGVLACVHLECLAGDVFGSTRCGCGERLELAMRMIETEGCGVVVYLRAAENRSVALVQELAAGSAGLPSHPPGFLEPGRDHAIGAQILADLGMSRMRLLTTEPATLSRAQGASIRGRGPMNSCAVSLAA